MSGVVTISQMSIAIVRGIGSHLGMEAKLQFIKAVMTILFQSIHSVTNVEILGRYFPGQINV